MLFFNITININLLLANTVFSSCNNQFLDNIHRYPYNIIMNMPKISIIISTYNYPSALQLVLLALNEQQDDNFEVVIADDGSLPATKELIDKLSPNLKFQVTHVWQPDDGFRVAQIRNKAIARCSGEYLLFIDHDCIPRINFIAKHRKLMERNFFVAGGRVLLNEKYTHQVISQQIPLWRKGYWFFCWHRLLSNVNRCLTLLSIPLGRLRNLEKTSWKRTKNLIGIWKKDIIAINGYNEDFHGWGYEDSEMVVRIIHSGVHKKLGKFATEVIHLYHPIASRDNTDKNLKLLQQAIDNNHQPFKGLSQYL